MTKKCYLAQLPASEGFQHCMCGQCCDALLYQWHVLANAIGSGQVPTTGNVVGAVHHKLNMACNTRSDFGVVLKIVTRINANVNGEVINVGTSVCIAHRSNMVKKRGVFTRTTHTGNHTRTMNIVCLCKRIILARHQRPSSANSRGCGRKNPRRTCSAQVQTKA